MKRILSLSIFLLSISVSVGQVLHGSSTVSSANNMTIDVTVDVAQNEVTLVLSGPNSVWFGYGFGGTAMFNRYTLITTGSGAISERKLGNHNSGTTLTSSLTSSSTSVTGSIRTDTIRRPIAGTNSNYFTFPTTAGSFMLIWGKGNGSSLANHGGSNRGSAMITLSPTCTNSLTALSDINICTGDSVLVFGSYQSTSGLYADTVAITGGCDSITQQNLIVSNASGPHVQTALTICNGDSAMVFGTYQNQNDTYIDTLQTTSGCDSILSQELIVTTVDTAITHGFNNLIANAMGATYQWISNCDSVPMAFPGATNSTFTPPLALGNYYSVVVTENGCSDTSRCILYTPVVSLKELNVDLVSLYPNPFTNQLTISWASYTQNTTIEIVSVSGQFIKRMDYTQTNSAEMDLADLEKGVYFIKISQDNKVETRIVTKL